MLTFSVFQRKEKLQNLKDAQDKKKSDFKQGKMLGVGVENINFDQETFFFLEIPSL